MLFQYNDVNMHYIEQGQGKPLLLLHGWGGNVDSFLPVRNTMQENRKVITVDFPGFGQSDDPPETWKVKNYAELIAAFIIEKGMEPVDIIAHSFGGRVAIYLASHYKYLVDKLILVDSAGLIPKRPLSYYIKVYRYKALKKLANSSLGVGVLKLFGKTPKDLAKNSGSSDYKSLNDTMKKIFVSVVNDDLEPYLMEIEASTLLIWGKDDKDTPVYFGEIMEKKIKDAGLVVLDNAGHFSYLDQFASFIKIVSVFLEG